MALPLKCCQSCGIALSEGVNVVRIQHGKIHYSQHVSIYRVASTDDYFCEGCQITVREAV